jgi:hypothetical protein
MTPQRLLEIEQLARNSGSPNGWTGTSGTLAAAIMELLAAYRKLESEGAP